MTRGELEGVVVTIDDIRAMHCAWGIKKWFDQYDMDIREVIEHGVSAQRLYDTGDALALAVIERKMNGRRG